LGYLVTRVTSSPSHCGQDRPSRDEKVALAKSIIDTFPVLQDRRKPNGYVSCADYKFFSTAGTDLVSLLMLFILCFFCLGWPLLKSLTLCRVISD